MSNVHYKSDQIFLYWDEPIDEDENEYGDEYYDDDEETPLNYSFRESQKVDQHKQSTITSQQQFMQDSMVSSK